MTSGPSSRPVDPVFVLAGGLGTRVAHLTGGDVPKALLPVGGHPFIDLKLLQLRSQGARHVVMLIGHGADPLREHVGDGSRLGLHVEFVEDGPDLLGTGGAIVAALASSQAPGSFWVTYGDTLLAVPLTEVQGRGDELGLDGMMTVLHNDDRWETSNVSVDHHRVVEYHKGAGPGTHHYIDYGMLWFRRAAFEASSDGLRSFDLSLVVGSLISRGQLGAFEVVERFHDIGNETAWRETDRYVRDQALWDRLFRALE